jgi:hypothetical protein
VSGTVSLSPCTSTGPNNRLQPPASSVRSPWRRLHAAGGCDRASQAKTPGLHSAPCLPTSRDTSGLRRPASGSTTASRQGALEAAYVCQALAWLPAAGGSHGPGTSAQAQSGHRGVLLTRCRPHQRDGPLALHGDGQQRAVVPCHGVGSGGLAAQAPSPSAPERVWSGSGSC